VAERGNIVPQNQIEYSLLDLSDHEFTMGGDEENQQKQFGPKGGFLFRGLSPNPLSPASSRKSEGETERRGS